MAKIRSHIDVTRRGSVAGTTYFIGKYSQIMARARAIPINPNSDAQKMLRMCFASMTTEWEMLEEAYRQGWKEYSLTVLREDTNPYNATGRATFIGNCGFVAYYNKLRPLQPMLTAFNPPYLAGIPTVTVVSVSDLSAPGVGFKITLKNLDTIDSLTCCAWRSMAQSIARNFWKGPYVHGSMTDVTIEPTMTGEIEFTGLQKDAIYFVKIRGVTGIPHRLTTIYYLRAQARETLV